MKSLIICSILVLIVINLGCDNSPRIYLSLDKYDSTINAKRISLSQLIMNYKTLQGQYIETTGIYYSAFEQSALFEDRISRNSKRALWIDFSNEFEISNSTWLKISEKRGIRVTIKGRVDTASRGHLSQYLATLRNTYYFNEN